MSPFAGALILGLLLAGPLLSDIVERNLELYCFILGSVAVTLARAWSTDLVRRAAAAPRAITIAVLIAGICFGRLRPTLESAFRRLRTRLSRPLLTAATVIVIGLVSSLITAIVAALMLIEAIGMLRLEHRARNQVAVAGCFAIGLGSVLTPAGGPFAAVVASALQLRFFDLSLMLGPWMVPGVFGTGLLAGYFARGSYHPQAELMVQEGVRDALLQAGKVFAFVAGLSMIGGAYAQIAARTVPRLSPIVIFWGNMISAAVDNAALAALEARALPHPSLRSALLSMTVSGGILIPGNIPNIICAGILRMRSLEWARTGIPIGLVMLGICFALWWAGY